MTESEARAILDPYHTELEECVRSAWTHWQGVAVGFANPSPRMRANVMYDAMVEQARRRFCDADEVDVIEATDRFLLRFGDRLLVHFKKVDAHLRSHNFKTQLALRFMNQLALPGIPTGARVTIGYLLDNLGTSIKSVHAILRQGNTLVWSYEIIGEPVVDTAPVIPIDVPNVARVKARLTIEDLEDGSEN